MGNIYVRGARVEMDGGGCCSLKSARRDGNWVPGR